MSGNTLPLIIQDLYLQAPLSFEARCGLAKSWFMSEWVIPGPLRLAEQLQRIQLKHDGDCNSLARISAVVQIVTVVVVDVHIVGGVPVF